MNNADQRRRRNLIWDSLIGVNYHLPDPAVILFPFLDNLFLLHQKPLVCVFWRGNRVAYSSLKDRYFESQFELKWSCAPGDRVSLGNTQYSLTFHSFRKPTCTVENGELALPVDREATELTRELIKENADDPIAEQMFSALEKGIDEQHVSQGDRPDLKTNELEELEHAEVRRYLEPVRKALDDVFSDAVKSEALTIRQDGFAYPNIFPVFRTCTSAALRYKDCYSYTAGLFLLSNMKKQIHALYSSSERNGGSVRRKLLAKGIESADECIAALEQPLGSGSRSVADLVFASGTVDIGRRPGESAIDFALGDDELEKRRRTAEECIYPPQRSLFYLPIHVGGTPWMSLFTLTPKNPSKQQEDWHHNYSFYRDLAQKAASLIRHKAHEAYEELTAQAVVDSMKPHLWTPQKHVETANRSLKELAQVYPFRMLRLSTRSEQSTELYVPGRGVFGASFVRNPFFPRHVPWKIGNTDAILEKCKGEIRHFTQDERAVELNATAQASHFLKAPLKTLYTMASTAPESIASKLQEQTRKILNLHRVAASLCGGYANKKRESFRHEFSNRGRVEELIAAVRNQYERTIQLLSDSRVSGNVARIMRELVERDAISFAVCISSEENLRHNAVFYDQLFGILLHGLLSNACRNLDHEKMEVQLRLVLESDSADNGSVFLEVLNSVSHDLEPLDDLVRRLNCPGPDMLGVSEVHWICKASWPERDDSVVWQVEQHPGGKCILARLILAEIAT